MKLKDIKDMPNFNPEIKNGIDSVSKGYIEMRTNRWGQSHPHCKVHGAMLKVSKDGIWRCGEKHCSTGCYEES